MPRTIPTPSLKDPSLPSNAISLNSTDSPPPPPVFTPPLQDGQTSSNETSLLDEDGFSQTQYGISTQEFEELSRDPSFDEPVINTNGVASETVRKFLDELLTFGPLKKPHRSETTAQNIPFRYLYECHRLASRASLPVGQFYQEILRRCTTEEPKYDLFWEAAKSICLQSGLSRLAASEKTSVAAWDCARDDFRSSDQRSVVLSGVLDWSEPTQRGIFTCRLSPLRFEKSCRFERRFGSDRFMYLTIPQMSTVPRDSRDFSSNSKDLQSAVARWLSRETHYIASRHWRAFYMEPVKKKLPPSFKVCLFAVSGDDFMPAAWQSGRLGGQLCGSRTPLSVTSFIDWCMPIHSNIESKDKKYFQRSALGLSRTYPTVILDQEEFVYLPENPLWRRTMNDGCARMSRTLANDISEILGLSDTPSVFQGRISGAKGLWMVEDDPKLYLDARERRDYWLEVSDSQLKTKPHPMDRKADIEHRTFEVLKWTGIPKVASMNAQLMGILHHGGVPREQLEMHLRANTHEYYEDLLKAMDDPCALRLWMHRNEKVSHEREMDMLGALPRDCAEQVNFLLEKGFTAKDNGHIVSRLRSFLTIYLDQYIERLRIKIDMSTSVWCVPDPYGVLRPGEIHLGFSQPWKGPNGRPITTIHDLECIVYRSPGYLPSDAQRVQGVFRPELQHLLDVVVFSTTGRIPLAHKLSGGDYDGDTCWVCFDQNVVRSFTNTPLPQLPPAESLEIVNKSRPLTDFFRPEVAGATETDDFLGESFSFNLASPMLGHCANEHEKLAYHSLKGHADPGAIKLAALAGYLVDAPKQGYFLGEKAWYKLRNKISGAKQLQDPAYKKGAAKANPKSIVDYLKLTVATDEKTRILEEFSKAWPDRRNYDRQLTMPFQNAKEKFKASGDKAGLRILDKLMADVLALENTWRPQLKKNKKGAFNDAIAAMHAEVQSIEPSPEPNHDIYKRFLEEKEVEFNSWSQLRAACLYYRWSEGFGPFYAVGKDLARIKANATGSTQLMVTYMHRIMKPDVKLVARMAERAAEEELEDEEEPRVRLDASVVGEA